MLDSFAFVTEKELGEAYGAGDRDRVQRAIRVTSELAIFFGALTAMSFLIAGGAVIASFVNDDEARLAAIAFLPYCAAVPVVGIAAWQLDGMFIGATQGKALRTAGVASMIMYVATDLLLARYYGNHGVWMALLTMYIYRAACLGAYWPSLKAQLIDRRQDIKSPA